MIRYLWASAAAIFAIFVSVILTDKLKGRNFSDVGVPMYTHSDFGFLAGLGAYGMSFFIGFSLLRKMAKLQAGDGTAFVVIGAVLLMPEIYLLRWIANF